MEAFDAYLSSPQHRDLSRALLTCAAHARGLGLIIGDQTGARSAALASTLAAAWPHRDVNLLQIDAAPTRVTTFPGGKAGEPIVVADLGTDAAVRSVLRQDPDVLVVTALEESAGQLLVNATLTGHAVVLATNLVSLDDAIATLAGAEAFLGDALRQHSLEFVVELRDGFMRRVLRRMPDGLKVFAEVRDGGVHVERATVPAALYPPPSPTRMAPAIAQRREARVSPRAAWLAVTSEIGTANSRIGTGPVFRPRGWSWPTCAQCAKPSTFVLQLDLAELPAELVLPLREGLVELFVCEAGCEEGVHLERVVSSSSLEAVTAPASSLLVLEPGAIASWRRFEEEPGWVDRERLQLPEAEDDSPRPLHADKLGGWPAWQQGAQWPAEDAVLLFQLDEGESRVGGRSPTWSFEEARVMPGLPPARVVDSEAPRHFPSLLTGEATAFIFMLNDGTLKFVWQTG
ncbi:MAG: ATPase, T2SS/T4P/T4SS family [Archangium sp.]